MTEKKVVCIGATLVDEIFTCIEDPLPATSNPASFYRAPGGVTCNIATHLSLLGHSVEFISLFGNDEDGRWLINHCKSCGMGVSHSLINDSDTGKYVAVISPGGDLFVGAASGHFEEFITPEFLAERSSLLKSASVIQFDCNLRTDTLHWLLNFCNSEKIPAIIDPVSVRKAGRLRNADISGALLITPNLDEMAAITGYEEEREINKLIYHVLDRNISHLWIRNGDKGSIIYSRNGSFRLPAPRVTVSDETGAGDAALAGWIHAWLLNMDVRDCVRYGHALAALILSEKGAILKELNLDLLEKEFEKNR